YELVKPYNSIFANNISGTKETVLELYYDINTTSSQAGQWRPATEGGVAWTRPTHSSLASPNNRWNVVALLTDPDIGGDRSVLIDTETIQGVHHWYGTLYYRADRTDPAFLIRTAELYLIRAEALVERDQAGDVADALVDLNAIRDRANVPLLDINDVSTKADLLLAIENENRVEFAFENHRWYDLVRTGRAGAVLGITNANRFLLPIPYNQVLNDPNLEPNPGLD